MLKVHILTTCEHCNGVAYLPIGEGEDYEGRTYTRFAPSPICEGSGQQPKWVSLEQFAIMLVQAQCQPG